LLVGNDVVDLHDPESQPAALHARFDVRVFTFDELRALNASASLHELRWTLWAAKESVYKVAKKLDPAVRFLPRDFLVRWVAEGRARVIHETGSFEVRVERTHEWIWAVATHTAAGAASIEHPVNTGIERLEAPGADASQSVREFVRAALGSRMDLPPGEVRIAADRGIPVALWRNRRLPVDVSLSHHGRFVAWAWGELAMSRPGRSLAT
jgi:phosphopantetheinyl transferase (holo-ACP synthase)